MAWERKTCQGLNGGKTQTQWGDYGSRERPGKPHGKSCIELTFNKCTPGGRRGINLGMNSKSRAEESVGKKAFRKE